MKERPILWLLFSYSSHIPFRVNFFIGYAKLSFADADKVAEWARPSVAAAYEANLIKGRGKNLLAPNENATRAEEVIKS